MKIAADRRTFRRMPRFFWICAIPLLLTWAALYLPHLRTSPAWYGDETGVLVIGRNLFRFLPAFESIWLTFWHTYYPIQPGYLWLTGAFAAMFQGDILGGRLLNALIALAIAFLICFAGRRRLGAFPAFFGAAMFLTAAQNVIHFRWIYPHNAVALGFALAAIFVLRRAGPRNDWMAGAGLAIATLSHPLFVHGAIAAALCRLKRPISWIRLAVLPTLALAMTFTWVTIVHWPKPWLIEDLANLAGYYGQSSAKAGGDSNLFANFFRFYEQDAFHIGAFVCLLACCQRRLYPVAIFGFTVSILLLQNRQNLPLFYYQAIVLAPLFGLAWAGALSTALRLLRKSFPERRLDRFLGRAVLAVPLIFALSILPAVATGKLLPKNQLWVTQNTREVEAAAAWLNEHSGPQDLVIANSNISWLLRTKTADYFQALLWKELPTEYFPNGIAKERFRYPADLAAAKFLVVGDIDQRWTLGQPNMEAITDTVTKEKWPVVWEGPNYTIIQNPRTQNPPAPEAPQ